MKPCSSLLLELRTLVWWHELVRDLIGGSLAVLNLYEKDDDFGSEDERSSSHSRTRKLRCGRLVSHPRPWPIFIG
jgi:hypothetical protein